MSFSEGFQGGWGLADSYLNRQDARKRQKVEDDRLAEETRYQRARDSQADIEEQKRYDYRISKSQFESELTRRDYWAEQERLNDKDITDLEESLYQRGRDDKNDRIAAAERKRLHRRQDKADDIRDTEATQNTAVYNRGVVNEKEAKVKADQAEAIDHLRIVYDAWDKKSSPSPELVKALRDANMMTKLDIEDPGKAVQAYSILEKAIQTGEFPEEAMDAANLVYSETINKRDPLAHADRAVKGIISGKSTAVEDIVVPKDSKITSRDIVGITPAPGGKGFVLKMRVQAEGPDGQIYEYIADSTKAGAADNSSDPQVFTPDQFLATGRMRRMMINEIQGANKRIRTANESLYMNSALGKGFANSQEAKRASAKGETDRREALLESEREWMKYTMPITAKNERHMIEKHGAWMASLDAVRDVLTRTLPNFKGESFNLTNQQRTLLFADFSSNFEANGPRSLLNFDPRQPNNSHLYRVAKQLLDQVPEAERGQVLKKVKKALAEKSKESNTGLGGAAGSKPVSPLVGGNYGNDLGALRLKTNPDIVHNRTEG